MTGDRRFWRIVTVIALAHVALLTAFLRWNGAPNTLNAQSITWLNGDASEEPSASVAAGEERSDAAATTTPHLEVQAEEKTEEPPTLSPAKSEIVLASPTPPTNPPPPPRPSPKLTPRVSPSSKPSPRKNPSPKKSSTPYKKKTAKPIAKKDLIPKGNNAADKSGRKLAHKDAAGSGSGSGSAGRGASSGKAADVGWYGNMLHDRFYRAWEQPKTVVSSGARLSAVAKIRIAKDGSVSDFRIVKPSGNVVVDESIAAVAKKVTRVDAPPERLGAGGHYDVDITFALSSQ